MGQCSTRLPPEPQQSLLATASPSQQTPLRHCFSILGRAVNRRTLSAAGSVMRQTRGAAGSAMRQTRGAAGFTGCGTSPARWGEEPAGGSCQLHVSPGRGLAGWVPAGEQLQGAPASPPQLNSLAPALLFWPGPHRDQGECEATSAGGSYLAKP